MAHSPLRSTAKLAPSLSQDQDAVDPSAPHPSARGKYFTHVTLADVQHIPRVLTSKSPPTSPKHSLAEGRQIMANIAAVAEQRSAMRERVQARNSPTVKAATNSGSAAALTSLMHLKATSGAGPAHHLHGQRGGDAKVDLNDSVELVHDAGAAGEPSLRLGTGSLPMDLQAFIPKEHASGYATLQKDRWRGGSPLQRSLTRTSSAREMKAQGGDAPSATAARAGQDTVSPPLPSHLRPTAASRGKRVGRTEMLELHHQALATADAAMRHGPAGVKQGTPSGAIQASSAGEGRMLRSPGRLAGGGGSMGGTGLGASSVAPSELLRQQFGFSAPHTSLAAAAHGGHAGARSALARHSRTPAKRRGRSSSTPTSRGTGRRTRMSMVATLQGAASPVGRARSLPRSRVSKASPQSFGGRGAERGPGPTPRTVKPRSLRGDDAEAATVGNMVMQGWADLGVSREALAHTANLRAEEGPRSDPALAGVEAGIRGAHAPPPPPLDTADWLEAVQASREGFSPTSRLIRKGGGAMVLAGSHKQQRSRGQRDPLQAPGGSKRYAAHTDASASRAVLVHRDVSRARRHAAKHARTSPAARRALPSETYQRVPLNLGGAPPTPHYVTKRQQRAGQVSPLTGAGVTLQGSSRRRPRSRSVDAATPRSSRAGKRRSSVGSAGSRGALTPEALARHDRASRAAGGGPKARRRASSLPPPERASAGAGSSVQHGMRPVGPTRFSSYKLSGEGRFAHRYPKQDAVRAIPHYAAYTAAFSYKAQDRDAVLERWTFAGKRSDDPMERDAAYAADIWMRQPSSNAPSWRPATKPLLEGRPSAFAHRTPAWLSRHKVRQPDGTLRYIDEPWQPPLAGWQPHHTVSPAVVGYEAVGKPLRARDPHGETPLLYNMEFGAVAGLTSAPATGAHGSRVVPYTGEVERGEDVGGGDGHVFVLEGDAVGPSAVPRQRGGTSLGRHRLGHDGAVVTSAPTGARVGIAAPSEPAPRFATSTGRHGSGLPQFMTRTVAPTDARYDALAFLHSKARAEREGKAAGASLRGTGLQAGAHPQDARRGVADTVHVRDLTRVRRQYMARRGADLVEPPDAGESPAPRSQRLGLATAAAASGGRFDYSGRHDLVHDPQGLARLYGQVSEPDRVAWQADEAVMAAGQRAMWEAERAESHATTTSPRKAVRSAREAVADAISHGATAVIQDKLHDLEQALRRLEEAEAAAGVPVPRSSEASRMVTARATPQAQGGAGSSPRTVTALDEPASRYRHGAGYYAAQEYHRQRASAEGEAQQSATSESARQRVLQAAISAGMGKAGFVNLDGDGRVAGASDAHGRLVQA